MLTPRHDVYNYHFWHNCRGVRHLDVGARYRGYKAVQNDSSRFSYDVDYY